MSIPSQLEFIEELEADERQCFEAGRLNNITDIALTIGAVLSSLTATILVSASVTKPWVRGAFAAIPAALTALQKVIDFRGRSHWYFWFSANLTALVVSLKYAADPNLQDFAERRAALELEGHKAWAKNRQRPWLAASDFEAKDSPRRVSSGF